MIDWISSDWIAVLKSSAITGILISAVGIYYKSQIEKRIQHRFDARIEKIRSELRSEEEQLRAELKIRGEQIAALRSGALSGLAGRYAALDKRRLEAIENIWAAAVKQSQYKLAAKYIQSINVEPMLEASTRQDDDGGKARAFADAIWVASGLDKIEKVDWPHTERPFVSPLVWAWYSAYVNVLSYAPIYLSAIRNGIGAEYLADPKSILNLVKSVLPYLAEFIEKEGAAGLPYLVDQLEEGLLAELQRSLSNPEADRESLERAAAILKAADGFAATLEQPPKIIHPPA